MTTSYVGPNGQWVTVADQPADGQFGTGGGGGSINPPITLTASTSLTKALHGNRTIFANSASAIVLTVDSDATTGMGSDDFFYVVPVGGGAHAFAAGTGTVVLPLGSLGGSVDQPFGLTHALAANNYVATDQAPCIPFTQLTFATTMTPDARKVNQYVTATNNFTVANPTNVKDGCAWEIWVTQDGTGSRVASWGTQYLLSSQVLSTPAGSVDILLFKYNAAANGGAGKIDVTIKKAVA